MTARNQSMEVRCTECRYSREVDPDDERVPAEYVVEHGRATGHTLQTNRPSAADSEGAPVSRESGDGAESTDAIGSRNR